MAFNASTQPSYIQALLSGYAAHHRYVWDDGVWWCDAPPRATQARHGAGQKRELTSISRPDISNLKGLAGSIPLILVSQ